MPATRRGLLIAAAALALLPAAAGSARAATPFTDEAFRAAQAEGRPILVEVWASWCPTCARQAPVVESLARDPAFAEARVFRIDFDAQRDALRALQVRSQSTLIVFRGAEERGRATGVVDPAAIRALFERAL